MPGSEEGSAETIGIIDQLISIGTVRRCLSSESQMAEREEGFEFHMGFLKLESLSRILDLQRIISESLPSREIFILHDEEYFRRIFSLRRSVIGIICEGELIGYSFILIPGLRDDGLCENLGIDLDLPVDELLKVAHLQGLAVHPAYRGNGLQRMMAAAHLKMIAEMGYVHACSTVSPKNPISLANLLSSGLLIEGLRPKFEGWWRFILHRSTAVPDHIAANASERRQIECIASISDLKMQTDLLKKGFKGHRVVMQGADAMIAYCRRAFP